MDIAKTIKGNLAFVISKIAKGKIDAMKIGKDLDRELDKAVGDKASEKIQRGPLTDLLLDLIEGLWAENPDSFKYHLNERIRKLDSVSTTITFGKKRRKKR